MAKKARKLRFPKIMLKGLRTPKISLAPSVRAVKRSLSKAGEANAKFVKKEIRTVKRSGAKVAGFVGEFKEFLDDHQVIALAVAFTIVVSLQKLVTAVVNDVVMPIVAVLVPGGDWKNSVLQAGPIKFLAGDLASALIDFLIIAFLVFLTVKFVMHEKRADASDLRDKGFMFKN
jgi:large conductance mechanosensitive channel